MQNLQTTALQIRVIIDRGQLFKHQKWCKFPWAQSSAGQITRNTFTNGWKRKPTRMLNLILHNNETRVDKLSTNSSVIRNVTNECIIFVKCAAHFATDLHVRNWRRTYFDNTRLCKATAAACLDKTHTLKQPWLRVEAKILERWVRWMSLPRIPKYGCNDDDRKSSAPIDGWRWQFRWAAKWQIPRPCNEYASLDQAS